MEKKKVYFAPEMKTVELKAQHNLLDCSEGGNGADCEIEGDLGFAPHEQDPLA